MDEPEPGEPDSDSNSSRGSLDAIDLVEEDLNRNERTRATGFFGKNSEVAWMQKLEKRVKASLWAYVGRGYAVAAAAGHGP